MSELFSECQSLQSLSYIESWNTCNLEDATKIINGCKSLISIPKFSKWDVKKLKKYDLNIFNSQNKDSSTLQLESGVAEGFSSIASNAQGSISNQNFYSQGNFQNSEDRARYDNFYEDE